MEPRIADLTLSQPVATLLVGCLALFAYRWQRRFDRRVDWYERVLGKINEWGQALFVFERQSRFGGQEIEVAWDEAGDAAGEIGVLVAMADVYAEPESGAALKRMLAEMNHLTEDNTYGAETPAEYQEGRLRVARGALPVLNTGRTVVIADFRRLLHPLEGFGG